MASMNDLIEGKVQTKFKEGPKSMNDLIEEVKPTPPIQVNLDTIVKTPDPIAKDVYKFMPYLGADPTTQGMMSQPEGGWNEFGVPIEKGKRMLPEVNKPDTLSIDTGKPNLIEQAINKVAGIFGEEYHRKLSPTAKAQATVQLMAKEAGVPLSLYRQSPEFLEQAANSFINMASLGLVPAFRESLTGEISFPATSTSGYVGGALGSLAGLFTTPTLMAGKVLAPVISNLPKATAEAPIVYRMLTESLRDAAILGPAMGLSQAGEALKSTTFSDAATNIWHGVKSGAITGALFGTTRGLLPGSNLTQTATRIASGLVGLNAQRALEVGGNPFTNRPVGEVIFDTLLDVAFLAKGMPKGEFAKLGNDIDNIVKKKADIEQKQEIVNNMLDEDLKRAQEEIIKVEKTQADLELAELTKKITYDQMIKEDLSSKGRRIEQIKQPKKAIADEVINKAMEKLPEEEVKKTMMSEIEPKEDVTFIGMQEGLNGELFPLVNDKNKSTITYDPEKHNIVNKEKFIKESHGIEMEPITDLDYQTGTMEPLELSTEKSPFRDTPERTQKLKTMYKENADKVGKDVEMATSKLINDVNRYLDGEEVPIGEVRDQLSKFASRADELRGLFDSRTNFDSWKATVSEAAKWARRADRLKNEQSGIKLSMGIDPKDIIKVSKQFRDWFKDSKVIDENGNPIIVYHGSSNFKGDAFDNKYLGYNTKSPSAKKGFFFSQSQSTSNSPIYKKVMAIFEDTKYLTPDTFKIKYNYYDRGQFRNRIVITNPIFDSLSEKVNKLVNKSIEYIYPPSDVYIEYNKKTKEWESWGRWSDSYMGSFLTKEEALQNTYDYFNESYSSNKKWASKYITEEELNPVTLSVYLSLQNPLIYDFKGKKYRDRAYNDLLIEAKQRGNDGAIFKNTYDGGDLDNIYVAFKPSQIKSTKNIGTFRNDTANIFYSGIPVDQIVDMARKLKPFYSKLEEVVKQKLGGKVEVEQMKKMLENSGVSKDEIKNLVGDLSGKVSKQDVLDEIKSNMTEFEDVVLGDINGDTHYSQYTEPGAVPGSYREMFVTAPESKLPIQDKVDTAYQKYSDSLDKSGESEETYRLYTEWDNLRKLQEDKSRWQDGHSQYSDIQNPIVRIRYNERDVNGKRILFIEEFQGPSKDNQTEMPDYLQKRIYDIGVKRAIALAKEQEFDGIAWTTGEMQANRYDLSKQISKVEFASNPSIPEEGGLLRAYDKSGKEVIYKTLDKTSELEDYIGKEAAKKLMERKGIPYRDVPNQFETRSIEGVDLKVGGEGLKYLYDKQIPSLMKKYGKGEIDSINLTTAKDIYQLYSPEEFKEVYKGEYTTEKPWGVEVLTKDMEEILDVLSFKSKEEANKYIEDNSIDTKAQSISITPKTPSTFSMYSGLPIDEAYKSIIDSAKRLSAYTKKARGMKEFKPAQAYKMLKEEFNRSFIDRSGNIRKELLDNLGDEGYKVVQKMVLQKGSSSLSALYMKQLGNEVYSGLNKNEKRILDNLILSDRMLDIGRYKTETQFKFPEGLKPTEAAAYNELFKHIEKIDDKTATDLKQRAKSYYEWMKKPLKDMFDSGLISEKEYNDLVTHNYRRLKIVDVFDKQYEVKVGDKKRTVYDSGVQSLAHGRDTDVFEPSSEIMALEVFNRAYGRIFNNEANKTLLDLARNDKENSFVRIKESRGDKIPTGWNRFFVYEGGERKSIYLSPIMSKEWITSNPEMSYKLSQILRYSSGSPILRTMATGIDWGFALANLPRDIMHTWFTARVFDNGKWKSVYNTNAPIFAMQIGKDQIDVFSDALLRKGRYEDYIKEGGGMEFLVHQGRLFQRGKHIEGNIDKMYNFLGYFGETSEVMTRLAIRERVIKNRAKEQGISVEEARKNKEITQEATFAARDYMDFGQGGSIAKAADNAIPYLNASIQGTRGLFRAFKDNPVEASYKLSQFAALVTGVYIAANSLSPLSIKALKGNIDMQNNLCIPLGDSLSFEDDKGQTRYLYFKIPLDPGQRFFKTFFEASTDKWLGNDIDVNGVVNSLSQISPVAISSLPPTLSSALGYVYNKDFWLNEDIWKKTDKPLGYPMSKEEYIPGQTPQAFIDLGKATGLSPERSKKAIEQLVTSGSMWSWLVGKGYETMFSEMPKDNKEKHLAEVLSKTPIIKKFIGITNPYSQFASKVEEAREEGMLKRWIENRGLDTLVDGYLYKDNVDRSEINNYMRSFKDKETYERLNDRFELSQKLKGLANKSFWLAVKGTPNVESRVKLYVDRMEKDPEQTIMEYEFIKSKGGLGIITDEFRKEVEKFKSVPRP